MANILCTRCQQLWDDGDEKANYYFASSGGTYNRGDYASPSVIANAGEDISYCPRCAGSSGGPLERLTEKMGGGDAQEDQRGEHDRETASSGGADVVHE